jgi:hypothetical protein
MFFDFIDLSGASPWAKPQGINARMAHYQAFTGVKPYGPHRRLADSLLHDITRTCQSCGGRGLGRVVGGYRLACSTCLGMGETYSIRIDELMARRQVVLDRFPDAGVSGWCPGAPRRCPLHRADRGPEECVHLQRGHHPFQLELPFEPTSV